jgi:hypothetical protein
MCGIEYGFWVDEAEHRFHVVELQLVRLSDDEAVYRASSKRHAYQVAYGKS